MSPSRHPITEWLEETCRALAPQPAEVSVEERAADGIFHLIVVPGVENEGQLIGANGETFRALRHLATKMAWQCWKKEVRLVIRVERYAPPRVGR